METQPPESDASRGRPRPLIAAVAAGLLLAVVAEVVTGTGGHDGETVLPGAFALIGAAATGLVVLVRSVVLRLAGGRRG